MARKNVLDDLDKVTSKASLKEQTKQENNGIKKREKKAKLIHIDKAWEDAINEYQDGTVTAYIRLAIREKMKRDGIL
jgi:hypothetical protein